MEATLLLCDFCEVVNGKLYIMGAGWDRVLNGTQVNIALAVVITVPWEQTNQQHTIAFSMVDEDGEPVLSDDEPVATLAKLEVGRPPGTSPGSTIAVPLSVRWPTLSLSAGRYVVVVDIDGTSAATRTIEVAT